MTFDPFGDFDAKGYLRNTLGLKDMAEVKRAEHMAFMQNLPKAIDDLAAKPRLEYADVLQTHKTLFSAFYPWAGQDRSITAPDVAISKSGISGMFALPADIKLAADYALRQGNDPAFMRSKPGEVLGSLAHAHPALDGNGRTILVVAGALAHRAGISIEWQSTDKAAYLSALIQELHQPGKGVLDDYLKPFVQPAVDRDQQLATLLGLKGLGPGSQMAKIPATEPDKAEPAKYKL